MYVKFVEKRIDLNSKYEEFLLEIIPSRLLLSPPRSFAKISISIPRDFIEIEFNEEWMIRSVRWVPHRVGKTTSPNRYRVINRRPANIVPFLLGYNWNSAAFLVAWINRWRSIRTAVLAVYCLNVRYTKRGGREQRISTVLPMFVLSL